jgi:hypothetical protein
MLFEKISQFRGHFPFLEGATNSPSKHFYITLDFEILKRPLAIFFQHM